MCARARQSHGLRERDRQWKAAIRTNAVVVYAQNLLFLCFGRHYCQSPTTLHCSCAFTRRCYVLIDRIVLDQCNAPSLRSIVMVIAVMLKLQWPTASSFPLFSRQRKKAKPKQRIMFLLNSKLIWMSRPCASNCFISVGIDRSPNDNSTHCVFRPKQKVPYDHKLNDYW